jgi:putative N6-adenine-specific DNA methylase
MTAPRTRPDAAGLRLFAVAAPGLEAVVAAEVAALPGVREAIPVPGGVEFTGAADALYRANLWLRAASRVLLRLGEVQTVHFTTLRRQVAALPWERYVGEPVRVKVAATAHRCRLYHSGGIAERVAQGIADRGVRVLPADAPEAPEEPLLHVIVRGEADVFTISIDTSGELLHRRGYRLHDTGAPLRETLAAGLLPLAGWDGDGDSPAPLYDPTCGSGTLVIEAALLASRRAPGRHRSFAFQRWPSFSPPQWAALLAEADAGVRVLPAALLHGSDLDPSAVATARANAERAGVAEHIAWRVAGVDAATLPAGPPGLVLCNPPYGVRLGGPHLARLYQGLGRLLRQRPGWRLAVLTSDARLARAAGLGAHRHDLHNGGLRVSLYLSAPRSASALGTGPKPAPRPAPDQRLANASVRSRRNTAGGRPPAVE